MYNIDDPRINDRVTIDKHIWQKPIILAVDDDPQVLRAVAQDLRKRYAESYRILRADSGKKALETLAAVAERGDPVAMILSDQRMPEMDGVSFLKEAIKLEPKAKRALLTAYADTEAAIGAINESQIDYYLLKPWDPPDQRLYPILDDLLADWLQMYKPGFGGVRILGDRWSARSHEVKDFLARNQIPYTFLDVEKSAEARDMVRQANGEGGGSNLPMVFLPDGKPMAAPSVADLAEKLGLQLQAEQAFYDLAIVGGGPAGLASAVYGASEGLRTVLIEGSATGGQAGHIQSHRKLPGLSCRPLWSRSCPACYVASETVWG